MAAHTPGPWHRNIPPASKYGVIFSGRNTHVAVLKHDSRVSPEEAEANINLISAAPKMLEALRLAEVALASYKTTRVGVHRHSLEQVRAAIAQAEGAAQ